ncbi:hypothetical protein CDL12_04316 [Handroanthus impetiginosus]|uniref:J domain-containing protein n=1 Tax=Handroanthus impetiginosus TaxID=429701 RepID=A0A2G9HZM3_9LAMI|nr:hypothetical protein CDL12_04316 [Handroanthus impetiginosus]
MECNKDEAVRAKEIAEKKMENNDFEGARKIALKAQNLYPELENITQLLSICEVHCSASNRLLGSEKDWYGILQVEKLADELMVKKQYRRLALILHPDKNRFPGAEAAFKLICEANAVLSDPAKKSLYDSKIKVSVRSAPVNPPHHQINKNSQPNKQYGAQNNVSNGFSSRNQHPATQSTFSARQDVFWTSCPFCSVRYQYLRQFVNKSLRCQTCTKLFIAYEISGQGVSMGSQSGQPAAQYAPPKPDSSRPAGFQEKVVQNHGNSKMSVQNQKGSSPSHAGSEGIASTKTVQPEPGVPTGSGSEDVQEASAAKVSGDSKTKQKDTCKANSLQEGKKGGKSNGDAINSGTGDLKNKNRKGRKLVESGESSDTSSDSDLENVTTKGNPGDPATDVKSESGRVHFPRRSSRKRQCVSYDEKDDDDLASTVNGEQTAEEDNGKEQKDALENEDTKHSNDNNLPADADYSKPEAKERGHVPSEESVRSKDADTDSDVKVRGEIGVKSGISGLGADTIEIESDSDRVSISSDNTDTDLCHCPDPEFSDFDTERDESRFEVNQFWACYDTLDGMPRFYAKVKKVRVSPFELSITWLEAVPVDEAHNKWVHEELPVGCGTFKLGKTEKTSARLSFSHQLHCEKGKKRGSLIIYPRKGEVWALLKNWDLSWSSDPENHKEFKYEIVEVLSDFAETAGIKVGYLEKVTGFVSLFQRASQSMNDPFFVRPNELYKFSHRVPASKMTGYERDGVPMGSFELDPAALPMNPDDLSCPGEVKLEYENVDPGVHCSPSKSTKRKGKSAVSEGTNTPKKFVDLEGIKGEMSNLRRSPRGLNFIRRKVN